MKQQAFENEPQFAVLNTALKDYEDLFLGKRSGYLTKYAYCYQSEVDYYEQLVQKEQSYYPARTEIEILTKHRHEIADIIVEKCNVVEIGPGPEYILKKKVIPLLKAFKKLSSYTAVDINIDYAMEASKFIGQQLQSTEHYAFKVDCTTQLQRYHKGENCLLCLGGTLSNFTDYEINNTFSFFARILNKGEYLIFSVDCNREPSSLKEAYGSLCNRNLLFNIMNYFKDAFMIKEFDPTKFRFEYKWNHICNAVNLNLISTATQTFHFNNKKIVIYEGRTYHMMISKKFTEKFIGELLGLHNFDITCSFTDGQKRMLVYVVRKR